MKSILASLCGLLLIGCSHQPPPYDPSCPYLPERIGRLVADTIPTSRLLDADVRSISLKLSKCESIRADSFQMKLTHIMLLHLTGAHHEERRWWASACDARSPLTLPECAADELQAMGFGGAAMGIERETIAAHFILADSAYETFKTPEFADLRADALIRANPKAGLDFVKEQRAMMSVERKRQACTAVFPTRTPFADYKACVESLGAKVQ